jgi:hypothetical protein
VGSRYRVSRLGATDLHRNAMLAVATGGAGYSGDQMESRYFTKPNSLGYVRIDFKRSVLVAVYWHHTFVGSSICMHSGRQSVERSWLCKGQIW